MLGGVHSRTVSVVRTRGAVAPRREREQAHMVAPSNLSPPLQVCFLVKRSRGTLAMPPARRLWPEAPRHSRFRFFLPF